MAAADTEILVQMFMYTHTQPHTYTNSNAIFILWFDFKLYTDVNIINIYTQKIYKLDSSIQVSTNICMCMHVCM